MPVYGVASWIDDADAEGAQLALAGENFDDGHVPGATGAWRRAGETCRWRAAITPFFGAVSFRVTSLTALLARLVCGPGGLIVVSSLRYFELRRGKVDPLICSRESSSDTLIKQRSTFVEECFNQQDRL